MRTIYKMTYLWSITVLFILFGLQEVHCQQEENINTSATPNLHFYSTVELERLANEFMDTPEETVYLKALLKRGLDLDSISIVYNALDGLSNHYLFALDQANLDYWTNYTDSLITFHNDNPNLYYNVHRNKANLHLVKKEYEQAIYETLELYNKALKTDQKYGLVCSSDLLGNIYMTSRRDSSAIIAFQEALNQLEQMENEDIKYKVRIISSLIEAHFRLNNLDVIDSLLVEFKEAMERKEQIDQQEGIEEKINWYQWQLYSFYAQLSLKRNQLDRAEENLTIASGYYKEDMPINYDFSVYYYLYVKASYNIAIKNYNEALTLLDRILKDSPEPECLKLKIEIFNATGKFKEALSLYKQLYQQTQEINNEGFIRQVNNLRVLYDKNDQLIQKKQLQLSNIQAKNKHNLFIYIMLASVVLLALLIILTRYLRRTYHIKNELEKERNLLILSQAKLDKEKKKAEKANKMKDAFVANISHEIRTPLNAIVGFSTLLSEMSLEEEEKKDFADLITKNSNLLLTLVNDVLDLSRMEAGRTKLNIEACEISECCQSLLYEIKPQVATDVKTTFNASVSPFYLNTDCLQLSQLLLNLLGNAAKFTQKGEINLSYEVDEQKEEVIFAVRDTGPGIPIDKHEKVFERFEKLDDYSQGTGLGLSICQTIAEQLNGTILIDPSYTQGARFLFIHPFQIEQSE